MRDHEPAMRKFAVARDRYLDSLHRYEKMTQDSWHLDEERNGRPAPSLDVTTGNALGEALRNVNENKSAVDEAIVQLEQLDPSGEAASEAKALMNLGPSAQDEYREASSSYDDLVGEMKKVEGRHFSGPDVGDAPLEEGVPRIVAPEEVDELIEIYTKVAIAKERTETARSRLSNNQKR